MKVLGGKLFTFCLTCLICGYLFEAVFRPERRGQGLTTGLMLVLVPIWATGVAGLVLFFLGSIIGWYSYTGRDPGAAPPFIPPSVGFYEEIFFDLQGCRRLVFDDSSVTYKAAEHYYLFWRTTERFIPYGAVRSVRVVRKRQWWALLMGLLLTPFWLFCIGAGTSESHWGVVAIGTFWLLITGLLPLWLFFRGRPFLAIDSEKTVIRLPFDRHKMELWRAISILKYFVKSPNVDWRI